MLILQLVFALLTSNPAQACNCKQKPPYLQPTYKVWAEFMSYEDIEAVFPQLKAHNVEVILALHQENLTTPEEMSDLVCFLNNAKANGIEISIWPMIPFEQGYWVNQETIDLFKPFLEDLQNQLAAANAPYNAMYLDFEALPSFLNQLAAYASKLQFGQIKQFIADQRKTANLKRFTDTLNEMFKKYRATGTAHHEIRGVYNPLVLYDFLNNQSVVQEAMHLSLVKELFDQLSFMAYRPEFEFLGTMNSKVVYKFGKEAKKLFGEKATLDIGEIGAIGAIPPKNAYTNIKDVQQDLAAGARAGITEFHPYSLDGLVKTGLINQLDQISNVHPCKPFFSIKFWIINLVVKSWLGY